MDNLDTVMTRDEAIAEFEATVLPGIVADELSRGLDTVYNIDEPMRSEAWNDYTDYLCKAYRISNWQYMNWTAPDCCERK